MLLYLLSMSYPARMLPGIDVSHHQGPVDFAAVAAAGFRYAFVKATDGTGDRDRRFAENWTKLLDLDGRIYRGAYHFARPESVGGVEDAKAEARDFCATLQAVGGYGSGCLPPVLDFESYSDQGPAENEQWVAAWVGEVEHRLGRSPMIYTGPNVWRFELGNSERFTRLPLWVVKYKRAPDRDPTNTLGLPWPRWTFHQWSGGGKFAFGGPVPGVRGVCDQNLFAGGEPELAALALVHEAPPCPDPDPRARALVALQHARGRLHETTAAIDAALAMLRD